MTNITNKYGPLAHLVEHLTLNQGVRGSSPRRPTTRWIDCNMLWLVHFFVQKSMVFYLFPYLKMCGLHALVIECWNETFFCCLTLLYKSIFNADINGIIHKLIVFRRSYSSAKLWKSILNSRHRGVLVHDAYIY